MNFRPSESVSGVDQAGIASPASGSHELGGSSLSASVENQLNFQSDISGAHQFFAPTEGTGMASHALGGPIDISGLATAPVMPLGGAEAGAFAAPTMLPGGDAAIAGVLAGANEPISPIIQLILRMPGAMGLINSFFEFFSNFFLNPTALFNIFDPAFLGHQVASAFSFTSQNLPVSFSLLPANAPLFQSLNSFTSPMMTSNLLSHKLNLALGQGGGSPLGASSYGAFARNSLNVSGAPGLGKPIFEGTGSSLVGDGQGGVLAGPGLTDAGFNGAGGSGHLATSTRLFSDKLAGGSIKNLTGSSSVPTTLSNNSLTGTTISPANVSSPSSLPSSFQVNGSGNPFMKAENNFASADQIDQSGFGPSGCVGDKLGSTPELIAMDQPATNFSPTVGGDASQAAAGSEAVGLKAKQLSLDSVSPAPKANAAITDQATMSKSAAPHAQVPAKPAAHAPAHKASSHHVSHKPVHKPVHKPAVNETSHAVESSGADGNLIAQAQAPGSSVTYTIQRGDNLWNIAKDYMGDGLKWDELYNLNQDILGDNPDLIYPGTTIQVPGQGAEIATGGSVDYVVQPGDNLWNISRDHLGEGRAWGDIYSLNQNVIGANPSLIHPGQHLALPSADPGASALSNAANSAPSQSAAVMSPDAAAAQAPAVDIRVDTPEIQSYGQDAISQPINSAEAQSMAPTIGPSAGPQAFAPTIGAPANAALPVIPANSLPVAAGPGAAQAATIQTGNSGQVVHSGLLSDLQSFLKPKKP